MATARSTGRRVPARTTKWLLGGACLVGVSALFAGENAVWIYGSLILCGLLLLAKSAVFARRRDPERSSLSAGSSDPEMMSASDLSSMTPPAWDAIPPTVGMAAQPGSYFHNRRKDR